MYFHHLPYGSVVCVEMWRRKSVRSPMRQNELFLGFAVGLHIWVTCYCSICDDNLKRDKSKKCCFYSFCVESMAERVCWRRLWIQ